MKVAVFAGTPTDTQMGVDILMSHGIETTSHPMAKTPLEQTQFQYASTQDLYKSFLDQAISAKEAGAEQIFLYCNSLSAAIDYHKIEAEIDMPIISPLDIYRELSADLQNIAILAANAISALTIDKILLASNPNRHTISIGNLSLVEAIETQDQPDEIMKQLNLTELLAYLGNIQKPGYQIDGILLGCTHLPYLKEELKKASSIPLIDPAEEMIKKLYLNNKDI